MRLFDSSTWVPLEEFGDVQQGATLSRVRDAQGDELEIVHIRDLDGLDVSTELERDKYTKEKIDRYLTQQGDVLVSLRANPVKASVVTALTEGSLVGSNLALVRPYSKIDPYFLAGLLRSEFINQRLNALIGGSVIPSLSVAALRKFELPFVPKEQQNILAQSFCSLERYKSLTDKLVTARGQQLEAHLVHLFETSYG